ncbi:MAG: S-layer family protein, partial [Cyanobacteria bacterium J06632_22]
GGGGSIQVNANRAVFSNGGGLLAATQSGNGGNIQLDLEDLLFLRDNALIDTESLGTGNGGNITINAPVIAGFDNSDIVASAVSGNGGNITINTQGIFGLAFRDQLTPENDITASSQFGVNGTVEINNFGVNPDSALVALPEGLVESSNEVAQGCASGSSNEFIATGRGGIPADPSVSAGQDQTWVDTRLISTVPTTTAPQSMATPGIPPSVTVALTEASTWKTNTAGAVELLATAPTLSPAYASCSAHRS